VYGEILGTAYGDPSARIKELPEAIDEGEDPA
jgi:hypothetical protein